MLPGTVPLTKVEVMACGWYHMAAASRSRGDQARSKYDSDEAAAASYTEYAAPLGSLHAWGCSAWGQLGTGSLFNVGVPAVVKLPVMPVEQEDGSLRAATPGLTALACGGGHSLAITADRQVLAWGNNGKGQLGMPTCTHEYAPALSAQLNAQGPVAAIAAGAFHSVAVLADGTGVLQCGVPTATQPDPQHPYMLDDQLLTDANMGTSLSEMWGSIFAARGEVDTGGNAAPPPPVGPDAEPARFVAFGEYAKRGAAVKAVACGMAHSAAIVGDGELWVWGNNDKGQCSGVTLVEEEGGPIQAARVLDVHAALDGGSVSLVACGALFTVAYSAETHRLAVCGTGAKELVDFSEAASQIVGGRRLETAPQPTDWHQIPLTSAEVSSEPRLFSCFSENFGTN